MSGSRCQSEVSSLASSSCVCGAFLIRFLGGQKIVAHTEFQLPCPHGFGRVGNEASSEVTLHTANHVVAAGLAAFADDAKSMVFHDGCAADAAEKTLLHAALELEDCNLG